MSRKYEVFYPGKRDDGDVSGLNWSRDMEESSQQRREWSEYRLNQQVLVVTTDHGFSLPCGTPPLHRQLWEGDRCNCLGLGNPSTSQSKSWWEIFLKQTSKILNKLEMPVGFPKWSTLGRTHKFLFLGRHLLFLCVSCPSLLQYLKSYTVFLFLKFNPRWRWHWHWFLTILSTRLLPWC